MTTAAARAVPSAHAPEERERQALADQVALVTGGGRGLGRAFALALAAAGATVAVAARSRAEEIRRDNLSTLRLRERGGA